MERLLVNLMDVIEPWLAEDGAEDGVDATAELVTLKLIDGTSAVVAVGQLPSAMARVDSLLERCPPWLVDASDVRRAPTRGGIVAACC